MAEKLNHRVTNLEKAVHELQQLTGPPWKQNKAGIPPQTASNKEGERTPGEILGVPPAPGNANNSKDAGNSPSPWRKFTRRKWRWVKRIFLKRDRLERIGIFFGIAYAIATIWQWHDLRHNFEVDQRAWIEPIISLPDSITESSVLHSLLIVIRNSGKSPALRLSLDTVLELPLADAAPTLTFSQTHFGGIVSLLFPSKEHPGFPAYHYSGKTVANVSKDEIKSLINGDRYLVVFVRVAYVDQFGAHWTRSCGWKNYKSGTYNAKSCVAWNSVGDGKPPD